MPRCWRPRSRHLIALREAGLVDGTRHGHEVRYGLTRLGGELIRSATGLNDDMTGGFG